jgi:6-phosphogluconolactonase (cycloisomerase 2 family)
MTSTSAAAHRPGRRARAALAAGAALATAGGAALLAGAPVASAASASPTAAAASAAHAANTARAQNTASTAVFVQTDAPGGNTVVAYHRAQDGSLVQRGVYPTGGRGGVLDGSVVDHLASQGSLAYDRQDHLLYAVNAGSDTVTVFAVHGERLTRLQVIGSGGSFPVSIAVRGGLVYVANALDGGSIQGFARAGDRLVRIPAWHRGLGLDPDAAPQFTHTPGQISFTPDGSELVVTTKAAADTIDVFPLDAFGGPSAHPVVTATPDAVPFGFVFDAAGRLQVTEAGPNAVATFAVRADGRLVPVGQAATGQAATCWIVRAGDHLYASNAGSGTLSGYRADARGGLTALGETGTGGGTVDTAVSSDGRFLYAQTGATGSVDAFRVGADGSLTPVGTVTVPDAVGGEGIVAG